MLTPIPHLLTKRTFSESLLYLAVEKNILTLKIWYAIPVSPKIMATYVLELVTVSKFKQLLYNW